MATNNETEPTPSCEIVAQLCDVFSLAAWHNSVPLISDLEIRNQSQHESGALTFRLSADPPFFAAKAWAIDSIPAGSHVEIQDRAVSVNGGYLKMITEAERCVVTATLTDSSGRTLQHSFQVRLLTAGEWGGVAQSVDLLASFVTPNDPAVATILKAASEILEQQGLSDALDGYQTGDRRRAFVLAAAIWSAMAACDLTYATTAASFEESGQKIRLPTEVLANGLGNCLDLTTLFASALEAAGLNPAILIVQGHCLVGVWLVDQTFRHLLETDPSEVRKAIALQEFIAFESTLVTSDSGSAFSDSIESANDRLHENAEDQYRLTLDIQRARKAQIRPLSTVSAEADFEAPEDVPASATPLADVPEFIDYSFDESPATPDGRVDRWQRKLLDLSLRNRLLNFRHTSKTIPFLCPDVPLLEDKLAEGNSVKIVSLETHNPVEERDSELYLQKNQRDIEDAFALESLQRNEVATRIPAEDLSDRLTGLYRQAKNDLAEGGTNTLFLAIGFLKWKRQPDDSRTYRAPILLVPVKLMRRSAASDYRLQSHEDGAQFNSTLIQFLRSDFQRDLSRLEDELPTDSSGVAVTRILQLMRHAVREMPGFEVVEDAALATFSFAKYLMWKDLVDRTDQLENNRVVRHLIRDPEEPFTSDVEGDFPQPNDMDRNFTCEQLVHPLAADSSQLAAVMAASAGHDFVLIGPPGTGKSQTIANMIAQCVSSGKTVLFVAEKTAALDVVFRRLKEHGLGNACLELHSRKAERKAFLAQLKDAWESRPKDDFGRWQILNSELQQQRDSLNRYVDELHRQTPINESLFSAMGHFVAQQSTTAPLLDWPADKTFSATELHDFQEIVERLARSFEPVQHCDSLHCIQVGQWSAGWESELLKRAAAVREATVQLQSVLPDFHRCLGDASADCSPDRLEAVIELAELLEQSKDFDLSIAFDPALDQLQQEVGEKQTMLAAIHLADQRCQARYTEVTLDRIPALMLESEWREACAAVWPVSSIKKRKLRKVLQTYADAGRSNPETDLPAIIQMQQLRSEFDAGSLPRRADLWNDFETDFDALNARMGRAIILRDSLKLWADDPSVYDSAAAQLTPELSQSGTGKITADAIRFLKTAEPFRRNANSFKDHAGANPYSEDATDVIENTISTINGLLVNRSELKRWTAWIRSRQAAVEADLASSVTALESRQTPPEQLPDLFRTSVVRWWLPNAIDAEAAVRDFERHQHEDLIGDFVRNDEDVRDAAAGFIAQQTRHELPDTSDVSRKSGLGNLRHQMNLQRPSKSIREVIESLGDDFQKLVPCVLMSPLSIAQYLPTDAAPFDIVIFDEASQITTWDAIGAIARGHQTVIVGDPKQLPPTNFFGRSESDEEDDQIADHEKDLESILDEARASGLPTLQLDWHYRSRHESLIAFSNQKYYDGRLITFPSAVTNDRAVRLNHLPDAVYDRGRSRTNLTEAQTIVADATDMMNQWLDLEPDDRPTIGVVTFNSQQQTLILDLFDAARREQPDLEWFFSDERVEPTIVRNLENVQGDERDVMLFSITFSPDANGRVPLTFGALNRSGGERRLNVAITRARQDLIVYSAIRADQINTSRTNAKGVIDLAAFLDFADRGAVALGHRQQDEMERKSSQLLEYVAEELRLRGWVVMNHVGVSDLKIDIGIVHPDDADRFIAGIECDGLTYAAAPTARDRDKTRPLVLRHLGWNIVRIWSPDWWYNSTSAANELDQKLRELLDSES